MTRNPHVIRDPLNGIWRRAKFWELPFAAMCDYLATKIVIHQDISPDLQGEAIVWHDDLVELLRNAPKFIDYRMSVPGARALRKVLSRGELGSMAIDALCRFRDKPTLRNGREVERMITAFAFKCIDLACKRQEAEAA
jgi:hypothetical protein